MNEIILTPIYEAIEKIGFDNADYTQKSLILIKAIFNEFLKSDEVNFYIPKPFPNNWFRKIITKPATNNIILKALKDAQIL